MKRLKQSELAAARSIQAMEQLWQCPICKKPIPHGKDVFDHDHETGRMRMVLHRGCNALEGRIHNNCRRHGVPFVELPAWLRGLADYLEKPSLDMLHPTFLTEDEKKARRNKRAKKARKIKKELEAHEP